MAFGAISPLNGSLLSQIANPPMPNMAGAVLGGMGSMQKIQQGNQVLQSGQQALQLGNQAIQQNDQTLQRGAVGLQTDQAGLDLAQQKAKMAFLQESAFDALAAFQMPKEKRDAFLQNVVIPKNANLPAVQKSLGELAGMPEREQNIKLLQFIGGMKELGILPGGGSGSGSGKGDSPLQKTGAYLVRDKKTGEKKLVTGVFDPNSGELKSATADLSGYEVISKMGETAEEETSRKVTQAQQTKRVEGQEARASDLIERGLLAAESTATTRRALELMKKLEGQGGSTGGFNVVSLAIKKAFGAEGADEGELSNNLGKVVLSQLRSTFGAQFTEGEGKRLARIEMSFGKSPETNIRLLEQALKLSERTAKRARASALERGDSATVEDIDDLLNFSLSPNEERGQAGGPAPTGNPNVVRLTADDLSGQAASKPASPGSFPAQPGAPKVLRFNIKGDLIQ